MANHELALKGAQVLISAVNSTAKLKADQATVGFVADQLEVVLELVEAGGSGTIDGSVVAHALTKKGLSFFGLAGSDAARCGAAVASLALSTQEAFAALVVGVAVPPEELVTLAAAYAAYADWAQAQRECQPLLDEFTEYGGSIMYNLDRNVQAWIVQQSGMGVFAGQ